jgi:hypothetical protein
MNQAQPVTGWLDKARNELERGGNALHVSLNLIRSLEVHAYLIGDDLLKLSAVGPHPAAATGLRATRAALASNPGEPVDSYQPR